MNDAFRVCRCKSLGNFDCPLKCLSLWNRTSGQPFAQALALEIFHDDERRVIVAPDVEHGANAGMIECTGSASLLFEAAYSGAILYTIWQDELHSYETTEAYIASLVDDTHAAFADLFENFVVRYSLTDHRALPVYSALMDCRAFRTLQPDSSTLAPSPYRRQFAEHSRRLAAQPFKEPRRLIY